MKNHQSRNLSICCIVLLFVVGNLFASPSFKWGFQERLRHTYMNNNIDFNSDRDDEQGFIRVRTSAWGQVDFNSNWSIRAQLNNEFRYYTITRQSDKDAGRENTLDEIIFEHLFLKYTTGGSDPLTVILGRQNLMYGEGFILMDGAPWDGSRTIYQDAAKISYQTGDMTYDFLAISNPVYDKRLPKFRFTKEGGKYLGLPKNAEGHQILNDGLEEAIGLYVTKKPAGGSQMEFYYFHKIEDPQYALPTFSGKSSAQLGQLRLNTVGFRLVQPLTPALKLTAEWAIQDGKQGQNKVNGYGGYANIAYTVLPAKSGVLTGGIYVLSGDDPQTAAVEGWNPLFSRWPKWSELYIYSHTSERIGDGRKVAYSTNTLSPNLRYDMVLNPKINITFWLHHLQAFYATASGAGTTRGNEIQLWVRFKLTKQLTAHFLADYFLAGDFYAAPADNAAFIRAELMYTLQ